VKSFACSVLSQRRYASWSQPCVNAILNLLTRGHDLFCPLPTEVSSRPERTRISWHAALDKTTCAPFRKEVRMKCTNAAKFHRKFGVA
jgi:hypothetical protein